MIEIDGAAAIIAPVAFAVSIQYSIASIDDFEVSELHKKHLQFFNISSDSLASAMPNSSDAPLYASIERSLRSDR
jgi:hypothetical protein